MHSQADHVVLAMTGASGSAYAMRLAQVLLRSGVPLHLVISGAARQVLLRELEQQAPATSDDSQAWLSFIDNSLNVPPALHWGFRALPAGESSRQRIRVHGVNDYSAGIASGSFRTRGMIICPCSLGTLASIANGASTNLIQRAADVHLKERRPLIVVPRETPVSLIALENMTRLTRAGATVMPSMPGFYHQPRSIGDLVDFIVVRICDHLGIECTLMERWGESPE